MKKFNSTFFILHFVLMFYSCENVETKSKNEVITHNEVVLLIESDDINNPIYIGKLPSYENYNHREHIINKQLDTLKIKILPYDIITIGAKKNFLDTLIVKKGDTVNIKLHKGVLSKSNNTRNPLKWDYKEVLKSNNTKQFIDSIYNSFYEKIVVPKGIKPLTLTNGKYQLFLPMDYGFKRDAKSTLTLEKSELILNKIKKFMMEYKLHTQNSIENQAQINLYNSLMKRELENRILSLYKLNPHHSIRNFLLNDSTFQINEVNRPDEVYNFINNRINLLYTDYSSKTPYLKENDLYRIYNKIPNDFEKKWIEKAKTICIERMILEKGNIDSIIKYNDKFKGEFTNLEFQKHIENEYLIDLNKIYNAPYKLNFINKSNEVISWKKLKTSLTGKVIYADYWASWCGPCRKAMPYSKKLRKFYEDKNVVFIYFSIDESKSKWRLSSEEEGIDDYEYNFLVLNHNASNVENELKIHGIPRYLLYDRLGNLINHDADGPETNEIQFQINSLLEDD